MKVTFPEKLAFLSEPHRYKVLYGGRGGIKSWSVAQYLLIAAAAPTILVKCCFDAEKCADGIQALRHYRYEVDEAKSDLAGKHVA